MPRLYAELFGHCLWPGWMRRKLRNLWQWADLQCEWTVRLRAKLHRRHLWPGRMWRELRNVHERTNLQCKWAVPRLHADLRGRDMRQRRWVRRNLRARLRMHRPGRRLHAILRWAFLRPRWMRGELWNLRYRVRVCERNVRHLRQPGQGRMPHRWRPLLRNRLLLSQLSVLLRVEQHLLLDRGWRVRSLQHGVHGLRSRMRMR
jgi:hypothetical protein